MALPLRLYLPLGFAPWFAHLLFGCPPNLPLFLTTISDPAALFVPGQAIRRVYDVLQNISACIISCSYLSPRRLQLFLFSLSILPLPCYIGSSCPYEQALLS